MRVITFDGEPASKVRFDIMYEGLIVGSYVKPVPEPAQAWNVRKLEGSVYDKLDAISQVKVCGKSGEEKKYATTGDPIRILKGPAQVYLEQAELEMLIAYINMLNWKITLIKVVDFTVEWLAKSEEAVWVPQVN